VLHRAGADVSVLSAVTFDAGLASTPGPGFDVLEELFDR